MAVPEHWQDLRTIRKGEKKYYKEKLESQKTTPIAVVCAYISQSPSWFNTALTTVSSCVFFNRIRTAALQALLPRDCR